jgi:hypothetical protein
MQPAIVFPFHDPDGFMFPHLQVITPVLKQNFSDAYLVVTATTRESCPQNIGWLAENSFYSLFLLQDDLPVGDQFTHLYRQVALDALPEKQLHLCFLDRLTFAIRTEHCPQFFADVQASAGEAFPLIFQRSNKAWKTHPQNYFKIENFITILGKILFGKTLDFAWCHLVIRTGLLREIMPLVKNSDMSVLAEMILQIQDKVKTKDVDWLAWEDPFLLSRDPVELRSERENSSAETHKRLAYAMPMIEALSQYSLAQQSQRMGQTRLSF